MCFAWLHGICAMSKLTGCLVAHVVKWNVEQCNYVELGTLAESLIQSEMVHFTWLLGNNAMDDVH